ncbi:MAG: type ISP restriction/modification enzyme, partial [Promethearchaeota archaeon]
TLRNNGRIRRNPDPLLENDSIVHSFDFDQMKKNISLINYRPFDIRNTIFYTINRRCGKSTMLDFINSPDILWLEKLKLIQNKILLARGTDKTPQLKTPTGKSSEYDGKIAFSFVQSVQKPPFRHFWVSTGLVDSGLFGYSTAKIAPWYLKSTLNFSDEFLHKWKQFFPNIPPITAFDFMYGLLMAPSYGEQFLPFLLHEYPRVVLRPHSEGAFLVKKIANFGKQLLNFHLGNLSKNDLTQIHQLATGLFGLELINRDLQSFHYSEEQNILDLHFSNEDHSTTNKICIPMKPDLWSFQIGSILVLKSWLKARLVTNMELSWNKSTYLEFTGIYYGINQTLLLLPALDGVVEKYLA